MTTALVYLACTLVLALVHVLAAAAVKRQQDGLQWAAGNRDTPHGDYTGVAGRLARAQSNFYEALPVFIGAVLLAHLSGREGALTAWGAGIFFWARVAYLPVYALGLVPWRTVVWAIGVLGLVLVLVSLA